MTDTGHMPPSNPCKPQMVMDFDLGEGQPSRSGKRRRRSSRSRGAQATEGAAGQSAGGQGQGSSHEGEN